MISNDQNMKRIIEMKIKGTEEKGGEWRYTKNIEKRKIKKKIKKRLKRKIEEKEGKERRE